MQRVRWTLDWQAVVALVALFALAAALCWVIGTPASGYEAVLLLVTSPGNKLSDANLSHCFSATCWVAWIGTTASVSGSITRPRSRRAGRVASPCPVVTRPLSSGKMSPPTGPERNRDSRRQVPAGKNARKPHRRDQKTEMPAPDPHSQRVPDSQRVPHSQRVPDSKRVIVPDEASIVVGPAPPVAAGSAAPPALAAHLDPHAAAMLALPAPISGRHLDDREWSRALLGLARDRSRFGETPVVWRVGPGQASGFYPSQPPAEAPFTLDAPGTSWVVEKDAAVAEQLLPLAVMRASMAAGLVTLWQNGTSRGLLDVVAARTVALDGPPVAVGYTLSDIVVELATRRWSDVDEIFLVGFGREVHALEDVRYLPTVAAASAVLSDLDNFNDQRARCFILAPARAKDGIAELAGFLRVVEQFPFVGAICCDAGARPRCTWHIEAHRETDRFEVMGRAGVAAVVSPGRWVDIVGEPLVPARRPSKPTRPFAAQLQVPHSSPAIEVRVLGAVHVEGLEKSIDQSRRMVDSLVYLACHPEGVTGDALAAALWPDRRIPNQTLANRLYEARRALGVTSAGVPRLQKIDGRHLLTDDVRTDWGRFQSLTAPGTDPASWRRAVSLVRGRPFGGLTQADWTLFEGIATDIETAIVEVSLKVSEHSLTVSDHVGAEWAARRGLMVHPYDERLHRVLMHCAYRSGSRAGVEAVLRNLALSLDWNGDPVDVVHFETADLYRQLTEGRDE